MTKAERQKELFKKILTGLDIAYERLIEYKKQKKTELVVIKNNKVVKINPEQLKSK